jgi:hypothetical protein
LLSGQLLGMPVRPQSILHNIVNALLFLLRHGCLGVGGCGFFSAGWWYSMHPARSRLAKLGGTNLSPAGPRVGIAMVTAVSVGRIVRWWVTWLDMGAERQSRRGWAAAGAWQWWRCQRQSPRAAVRRWGWRHGGRRHVWSRAPCWPQRCFVFGCQAGLQLFQQRGYERRIVAAVAAVPIEDKGSG